MWPITSGVSVGLFIGGDANITSRVLVRDCDFRVSAGNLAFGLLDGKGVTLEVRDTSIVTNSGPGASIALRLGQRFPEGDPTPNHNLRLLNSSLEANVQTGFASGIDIIADGGGTVRIMGSDIRGSASDASETRGITSIGSNVRANGTLFFAAHPFFVENGELRCAHCGVESFINEVVDPTGAGSVLCLNSYDEASFDPLDNLCARL